MEVEKTEAVCGEDLQPAPEKKKKKVVGWKKNQNIFLFCILLVPALNWLVFWLYVNLSSFILAFQNNSGEWSLINFTQFWDQLTSPYGDTIGAGILNTLKYFAQNLFIIFPLTLIISYFIYKRIAGYAVFRVIFFLPAIISGIVFFGKRVFEYDIANRTDRRIVGKNGHKCTGRGLFAQHRHGDARHHDLLRMDGFQHQYDHHQQRHVACTRRSARICPSRRLFCVQRADISDLAAHLVVRFYIGDLFADGHLQCERADPAVSSRRRL